MMSEQNSGVETRDVDDAVSADVEKSRDDPVRTGRDAAATREALLRAARRRFATEGYRATTVRQIASDVRVNVALISRYFDSKEGLFEACMRRTSDELETRDASGVETGGRSLDEVIDNLISHVVNSPDGDDPLQLVLLLRSSGDEGADRIRRQTLERFAVKLAEAVGGGAAEANYDERLLRAQLAIGSMLGIVMLRTSAAVHPVAAAPHNDLAPPLKQVLLALLATPTDGAA